MGLHSHITLPPIALVTSQRESNRVAKRWGYGSAPFFPSGSVGGRCSQLTDASGAFAYCVQLVPKESRTSIDTASILVHEAAHIFQFMMDAVNEDKPGTEVEAYTLQAISHKLFTLYSETMQ